MRWSMNLDQKIKWICSKCETEEAEGNKNIMEFTEFTFASTSQKEEKDKLRIPRDFDS